MFQYRQASRWGRAHVYGFSHVEESEAVFALVREFTGQ
jgi:hypothetical protein